MIFCGDRRFPTSFGVVVFGFEIFIENIDVRFLDRQKDWIFPPKYLKCKFLNNHFKQTFDKEIDIIKNSNEEILTFSFYINKNVKEIEIFAENLSKCPEWHVGAGKPSWIFIDEIIVN